MISYKYKDKQKTLLDKVQNYKFSSEQYLDFYSLPKVGTRSGLNCSLFLKKSFHILYADGYTAKIVKVGKTKPLVTINAFLKSRHSASKPFFIEKIEEFYNEDNPGFIEKINLRKLRDREIHIDVDVLEYGISWAVLDFN